MADTFEWSEGTIGGTGTLTLGSGSTGTVNPYARAILDGKTLVNLGTLNWYSGSVIGAGGAEILNKGTYELDDQGPTAECWGCHGMYTAGYLRATFGESYFWVVRAVSDPLGGFGLVGGDSKTNDDQAREAPP